MMKSSKAAEIIGNNEDLMIQIALYLPVKSIVRFLSVSKQWKSLLTDSQFVHHYASHTRSFVLFFRNNSFNIPGKDHNLNIADFGYLSIPRDHILIMEKSCNGLLLFNSYGEIWDPRYYVCNPSTRRYRELAIPDYVNRAGQLRSYLAFDPSTSPFYKVILISPSGIFRATYSSEMQIWKFLRCEHFISIYSSETQTWKKLDYTPKDLGTDFDMSGGKFFNGAILWFNKGIISSYFHINQESFSLEFPKPPPPTCFGRGKSIRVFGGCGGGHLYLMSGDRNVAVIDVYELKQDFSSWVAKYKVDFDAIASAYPQVISGRDYNQVQAYVDSIVCVLEKEEDESLVIYTGNRLIAYSFVDKTINMICSSPYDLGNIQTEVHDGHMYCIESLSGV